jgi:hypothetical protein
MHKEEFDKLYGLVNNVTLINQNRENKWSRACSVHQPIPLAQVGCLQTAEDSL